MKNSEINENIDGVAAENAETEEKKSEPVETTVVNTRIGKNFYAPAPFPVKSGDVIIAESENGLENAAVYVASKIVDANELSLPLPRIIRKATQDDLNRIENNREKEVNAFNICLEQIEKNNLPMKLVDSEYSFDCSRLTFYFTADDRVDFRELVKGLATTFRTRIELHQIGIRDEAKLIGGIGPCGRPFCCRDFQPVSVQMSIKMAKEQGLSLNSAKISGACNRLMCCLKYEQDFYREQLDKLPKVNSIVGTPDGDGVVTEVNPLEGTVRVFIESVQNTKTYVGYDLPVKGTAKKRSPEKKTEAEDNKK